MRAVETGFHDLNGLRGLFWGRVHDADTDVDVEGTFRCLVVYGLVAGQQWRREGRLL